MRKGKVLPLAKIPAALAAHEKAQEASDAIRAAVGLAPVPENGIVLGWRARLAEHSLAATTKAKAPTAAEARVIAKAALTQLGLEYPATSAEVPALIGELETESEAFKAARAFSQPLGAAA